MTTAESTRERLDEAESGNGVAKMENLGWSYSDIMLEAGTVVFCCDCIINLKDINDEDRQKLTAGFLAANLVCDLDPSENIATLTIKEEELESFTASALHKIAGNALSAFTSGFSADSAMDVLHGRKLFTSFDSKYVKVGKVDEFFKFMKSCQEMMKRHKQYLVGEELIFDGSAVHMLSSSGFLQALKNLMNYVFEKGVTIPGDLLQLFTTLKPDRTSFNPGPYTGAFWEAWKTPCHPTPQVSTMLTSSPRTHSTQVLGWAFIEQYYYILNRFPDCICKFYGDTSILQRPGGRYATIGEVSDKQAWILPRDSVSMTVPTSVNVESENKDGVSVSVTGWSTMKDDISIKNFTQSFIISPRSKGAYFVIKDDFRYVDEDTVPESPAVPSIQNEVALSPKPAQTVQEDPPVALKESYASKVMKHHSKTASVYAPTEKVTVASKK